MRNRIFIKMVVAFALVIAVATAILNYSIQRAWDDAMLQEIKRDLRQKTLMFAQIVNADRVHNLRDITAQASHMAGARATVVDFSGKVLADSQNPGSEEDYPNEEPELAAAYHGEVGQDVRESAGIHARFLYTAVPVEGGAVRLAYPLSDIAAADAGVRRKVLLASALVFLASLVLAGVAADLIARRLRRIVRFAHRVAAGDLTARLSPHSGDEIGQVASALDKTARHLESNFIALKASQHELETLLNSMQDSVIAVGADERVQWANQAMEDLVPHGTRLKQPVVETIRDPDFLRVLRAAIAARSAMADRATSILPGRSYDVTAAPLPGGGAVVVLRDRTETERLEKTRRDFIANVSHELRTPLTSIQGYTETLIDGSPENASAREFLEIIRKNAIRMTRLTEDLLTLARVESGEHQFDVQPVLPRELLQEAVQNFRERARVQGMQLQIEDFAQEPVIADREAIHQVFSNLIDNALKYAPESGRIILGARRGESGVEFYVRDFGPGISSEHLLRLFERFYRVDKARSRESGGTGLGLAIAKHIVRAHSGTIRAESELNHGATFLFTLPTATNSVRAGAVVVDA